MWTDGHDEAKTTFRSFANEFKKTSYITLFIALNLLIIIQTSIRVS